MHARLGDFSASANCYRRALSINPNEPRATANLITIYKQTGEFQPAQELISALSEEQHQHPDILKAIADLKSAEGDNVSASHYLAGLASSHPNRAANWLNWAASLKSMKFTVAPARILKRGLQFNPDDRNSGCHWNRHYLKCNFEAADKICVLQGHETDLTNSEQLFNPIPELE